MKRLKAIVICVVSMGMFFVIMACASQKMPAESIPQKFIGKWESDDKKTEILIGPDTIRIISLHVPGQLNEELVTAGKFRVLENGEKIIFPYNEIYGRDFNSGKKYVIPVAAEIIFEGNKLVFLKKEASGPSIQNARQLIEWCRQVKMHTDQDQHSIITIPESIIKLNICSKQEETSKNQREIIIEGKIKEAYYVSPMFFSNDASNDMFSLDWIELKIDNSPAKKYIVHLNVAKKSGINLAEYVYNSYSNLTEKKVTYGFINKSYAVLMRKLIKLEGIKVNLRCYQNNEKQNIL